MAYKDFRSTTRLNLSLTFHGRGHYHIETSPLICSPNQWTGFYMITPSVMKELICLGHGKMIFCFFEHTLKWPCAIRFICLQSIHAESFYRNKMSIRA